MACTEVVVHRAGRNLGLYLTAAATFAGCAHLGPNTVAVDRFRWVIRYVPEFEKRWNRFARPADTSWRVDETYINIRPGHSRQGQQNPRAETRRRACDRCASRAGFSMVSLMLSKYDISEVFSI